MSLLKEMNDVVSMQQPNVRAEMQTLAKYWIENGSDMTDDEIREAIGNDLEQLEYTPEQVNEMVPQVMKMVRGGNF